MPTQAVIDIADMLCASPLSNRMLELRCMEHTLKHKIHFFIAQLIHRPPSLIHLRLQGRVRRAFDGRQCLCAYRCSPGDIRGHECLHTFWQDCFYYDRDIYNAIEAVVTQDHQDLMELLRSRGRLSDD